MSHAVTDNEALSRFEMREGDAVAFASYVLSPGIITLTHTEVPQAMRGQGVGGRLLGGVMTSIRARGLKVIPRCSFVAAYLREHPEFNDLRP